MAAVRMGRRSNLLLMDDKRCNIGAIEFEVRFWSQPNLEFTHNMFTKLR